MHHSSAGVIALHNCGPTDLDLLVGRYRMDDVGFRVLQLICEQA